MSNSTASSTVNSFGPMAWERPLLVRLDAADAQMNPQNLADGSFDVNNDTPS